MTTHTSIHQPVTVEACIGGGFAYLNIEDKSGNIISVHMDADKARAMAEGFNAYRPASFATSA